MRIARIGTNPRYTAFGVAILLAASSLYAFGTRLQNTFVVENQTGQAIDSAWVEVADELFDMGRIPAGGRSWKSLRITCDGGYKVFATLRDGTRIHGADGLVKSGYSGMRDRIILRADRSVELKQNGPWP